MAEVEPGGLLDVPTGATTTAALDPGLPGHCWLVRDRGAKQNL